MHSHSTFYSLKPGSYAVKLHFCKNCISETWKNRKLELNLNHVDYVSRSQSLNAVNRKSTCILPWSRLSHIGFYRNHTKDNAGHSPFLKLNAQHPRHQKLLWYIIFDPDCIILYWVHGQLSSNTLALSKWVNNKAQMIKHTRTRRVLASCTESASPPSTFVAGSASIKMRSSSTTTGSCPRRLHGT